MQCEIIILNLKLLKQSTLKYLRKPVVPKKKTSQKLYLLSSHGAVFHEMPNFTTNSAAPIIWGQFSFCQYLWVKEVFLKGGKKSYRLQTNVTFVLGEAILPLDKSAAVQTFMSIIPE